MFKEIVLKNRKTSLVLESTISKVSKVNLNHFSTNWIRKCGISFKRIALILERKTNFFDSDTAEFQSDILAIFTTFQKEFWNKWYIIGKP